MDTAFQLQLADLPKEFRALLLLLDSDWKGERLLHIEKALLADLDWQVFLQLARHHRVYPYIANRLKQLGTDRIPETVITSLLGDYRRNTFQMLHLSGEMQHVVKTLHEQNIRTLLLKGPALAHDLYGDVSLRTSGDLDILIPIQDLFRAEAILIADGYVKDEYIEGILQDWKWRHHHFTFIHPTKGCKLELHWRLHPGPAKEPGFEELWRRRRVSTLTPYPIPLLGREDLLLFLVTHGARHGWSRLRWLLDIHLLSQQQELNWTKAMQFVRKHQYAGPAGQALILASQCLRTPLADETAALVESKASRKLATVALFYFREMVNLHTEPVPPAIARYHKRHLFMLMSIRHRLLFILSFLYPYPEDAETLPLPSKLHFLYFLFRPFLWAWRKTNKLMPQKVGD